MSTAQQQCLLARNIKSTGKAARTQERAALHTCSMTCASSYSFLASSPTVSSLKILG